MFLAKFLSVQYELPSYSVGKVTSKNAKPITCFNTETVFVAYAERG